MSDWGQDSEDLFRNARLARPAGLSPSKADRERVRARIAAKLAGVAAGAAVTTATAKAGAAVGAGAASAGAASAGAGTGVAAGAVATKGLTLALVAKIMAPIVIAGVGLAAAPRIIAHVQAPSSTPVGATHATRATHTAPPFDAKKPGDTNLPTTTTAAATPSTVAPEPGAPEPGAPEPPPAVTVDALPVATGAIPAATAARSPSHAAPTTAPSAAMSSEEALLVGAIDTALRNGDAGDALRLAAEHERRFPRGVLAQEREGARVVARCMNGAKSSSGAAAFLAAHPRTPMRARIVAACETGDTGEKR